MERVRVFRNNKIQTLRFSRDVSFPDTVKEVDIICLGHSRLVTPAGEAWDNWFDGEGVTDDFMNDRDQTGSRERGQF